MTLARASVALLLTACAVLVTATPASAQDEPKDLTDFSLEELLNVPLTVLDVMGTHTHYKGEWMVSYRFGLMSMAGLLNGTSSLSEADVLQDFLVTPTEMTMEMHMVSFMYAPSDRITLMVMAPLVSKSMDHLTRSGVRFTTDTDGIGDTHVGVVWTAMEKDRRRLLASVAVGLPTGSTSERGATPMGPDQKLPYPMQLGSGTVDLLPRLTYIVENDPWEIGGDLKGSVRTGENSSGYSFGDQWDLGSWLRRSLSSSSAITISLRGLKRMEISGADAELNPLVVPTADPALQGGERVDLALGVDFLNAETTGSKGLRFGLEAAVPVYQSLDGPQLETDWKLSAGVSWTF